MKYYHNESLVETSSGASGEYYVYSAIDGHGKYAEYVAVDSLNTGTYTQMLPEHWDIDNAVYQAVDSAGKVTKTGDGTIPSGWNSYIFSNSNNEYVESATTTADATVVGVELGGTFYPTEIESTNWVHHVLTKDVITATTDYGTESTIASVEGTNNNGAGNGNRIEIMKAVDMTTDAPITKIGAQFRADESSTKMKFVIYERDGGNPDFLLAYTDEFYPQETDGWEDQPIAYVWDGSSYVAGSSYSGLVDGQSLWILSLIHI